jgi:uncharacterized protein (TIGR02453 family)
VVLELEARRVGIFEHPPPAALELRHCIYDLVPRRLYVHHTILWQYARAARPCVRDSRWRALLANPRRENHVDAACLSVRALARQARTDERSRVTKATGNAFPGFEKQAMQFWHELAIEMNKDWFVANKQRYEDQWVEPMDTMLADLARRLAPAYKPLKLGEPKTMRIYRDVRFAKDKTPYKTHIAGVIRLAGKPISQMGNAVLYVHLGLDEEYTGAGCYFFDPSKLARWRKAVVGKPGDALLPLMAKLRKAGYRVGGHEDYKRVPSPFAADHPRAELLKMRGLTCGFPEIPRGMLHKPAFEDWLFEHARACTPIVTWLHRHVG